MDHRPSCKDLEKKEFPFEISTSEKKLAREVPVVC
jgi:hypothetical protein